MQALNFIQNHKVINPPSTKKFEAAVEKLKNERELKQKKAEEIILIEKKKEEKAKKVKLDNLI